MVSIVLLPGVIFLKKREWICPLHGESSALASAVNCECPGRVSFQGHAARDKRQVTCQVRETTDYGNRPEFRRLLTIRKKGIEREDRGMVAGQPVTPAYVHYLHDVERDTGQECFLCNNRELELCTKAMTFALRAFAAFFARSSRCMKNSPIIVPHQSGTREDLNSDDPFSSNNVVSDEFIFEELFLGKWNRYLSHRIILRFYRQ